jgi:hypothetical protein
LARLLLGVVLLLTLIAAGTYWAGEQTEVAVLRTSDTLGRGHETKMWVVDHQGVPWVRVANPERGWYRRLLERPRVVDWWYGLRRRRHAIPVKLVPVYD